ncbi:MAG: transcriptional regulator [Staphylococcus hominis]|nr:MAG: transcriptional regulator [Staphylococcus hominis]
MDAMLLASLHPEDIKAALRKKHRTIDAFARSRGLKPQAVADWLRGRTSAPVATAIADELGLSAHQEQSSESMKVDDSGSLPDVHRLNAEAR